MISDKAIDSLIICDSISGSELYDNFNITISRKNSFGFVKLENIVRISEEFILSVHL